MTPLIPGSSGFDGRVLTVVQWLPALPLEFSDFLIEITVFIRTDERRDEFDEFSLARV
jgi:hypothetical protein